MKVELDDATYARCHIDIRAVMDRYALSIARRDWEGVASCYTQDATFQELPPVEIRMNGRDEIVKGTAGFAESLKSMFMMIHSCLIETDGEAAHAFTVLHETGRTRDDEDFNMFGYYSDRLVNEGGSWRVRENISAGPMAISRQPDREPERDRDEPDMRACRRIERTDLR